MLWGSQSYYARSKMSLSDSLASTDVYTRYSHNAQLTSLEAHEPMVSLSPSGRCVCKAINLIALTRCCCIVLWVNLINRGTSNLPDLFISFLSQSVNFCIMLQNSSNWISPSPFSSISLISFFSSSPSSSEMPRAYLISSGEMEPFPSLSKRRKAALNFCYEMRSFSFMVAMTNSV